MTEADAIAKLIGFAQSQLGYEAQDGKKNKFAEYLDSINFYNNKKNGYDWCAVFVDYCFVKQFGVGMIEKLKFQPVGAENLGASCTAMENYFRAAKACNNVPKVGAQMFRHKRGERTARHTGIVTLVNGDSFNTIEGNVGSGNGFVRPKTYDVDDIRYEFYFGYPDYSQLVTVDESAIAKQWVESNGIFIGGLDGNMHYDEPMTREQFAIALHRFFKLM